MAVAPAESARAATLGPITTSFEIDGNKPASTGVDWDTVLDGTPTTAPYITASGHQSSGIIDASFAYDSGASAADCTGGVDNTVFAGGDKIDDNPWTPNASPEPNAKGDGCSTASAYEIVDVGGVPHYILYQYWTRLQGLGDMTTYQVLAGPDPSTFDDDYLVEFDYQSSGPTTNVRILDWDGNSWEPIGASFPWQAQVGKNTDTPSTGNDATFGELAVDLTAAGVLGTGTCRTFTVDGFITRTGNNQQASTEDIVRDPSPLSVSNCGGLVVKKAGSPAGAPDAAFNYAVTRTGAGQVHDGTLAVSPGGTTDTVGGNNGLGSTIGLDDTHTWSNVFAGNDYQISESAPPAPWALQGYSCTVVNPTTQQTETTTNGSFKLYVGATTTCTITNVTSGVKITKVAQGDAATFDYTVTGQQGNVQVAGNSSSQVFYYTPGTPVTITELPEPGLPAWKLTGIECTGDGEVTSLPNGTATVTTVAGQVLECTYTNRQDGQIKIIKNVAGANGTFEFTTTGTGLSDFDLTTVGGTGEKLFSSVAPGAYTVTETSPAPLYDLTNLSCVEDVTGDSVATVANGKSVINVQPGELVTCTYTNTQRGNIVVTKQTNPDGSAESFDFTLTGQTGFSLQDGGSKAFNNIVPGAYALAELAKAGWDVTSMTCTGENPTTDSPIAITLSPGETVECTVLNTATKGGVTVEKKVTGVPDDYAWSFPISISPEVPGQPGTRDATNVVPKVGWTDLDVGVTYTLTEGNLEGWDEGDITCTGITDKDPNAAGFQFTVTPGLALVCEVTNDAEPGEVSVEKTVSGVSDDTEWSFDLTIDPSTGVLPSATQAVSGTGNTTDTVTWTNLDVGTEYTITEELPDGWTGGVVDCGPDSNPQKDGDQFLVTPGFELECTVRNEAVPASAKVTKTSVGAGGSFTFVLTPIDPSGDTVEQTVVTDVGGGTGATTFADLVPGTEYSIAEKAPGDDWVVGALVCEVTHAGDDTAEGIDESGFTVEPGDVFECTITNTAKGKIIIVKNIDGADGTFDFTGNWPGTSDFEIETENGTGQVEYSNVVAGSYTVTEVLTSSHVGELQACVESRPGGADNGSSVQGLIGSIDLDPGETITCTYSNTQLGKIIVDKNVTFDSNQSFDFEYTEEAGTTSFALTGSADPWESDLLEPGTYSIEELGETNWQLQSLECVGSDGVEYDDGMATIELLAGEVVTCTYVNTPDTGDVTVRKIVDDVPAGYDFDFVIEISPQVGDQDVQQHVTDEDSSVTWTDLVVGETYTLTETPQDGWVEGDFTCNGGNLEDADDELDGFQFLVTPGLSLSCTITNTAEPGDVTVTKHVTGVPDGFEWSFPLTISPADGVLPDDEQTVSGTGDETDSVTWTNLEIGTVYTVEEGELPEGWSGGEVVCEDSDPQTVGNQFVATPGASLTCDVTNDVVAPTGLITKELVSIEQATDGTWDLVYEVEVTNQSPIAPLIYDLDDQPYFGVGIVINEGSAEGPSEEAATWDPTAPPNYVLADDASLAASDTATYTITINATAGAEVYETSQQLCQEGDTEAGGFRNTAFLTVGEGDPQPASDCDEPGRTTVTKELIGSPVLGDDRNWTVTYEVTVTNQSDLHDQYYDLEDDLGFPEGVEIVSADATTDAPDTGPGVDVGDWNGDTETTLADDAPIAKSAVHTYTIVVVADVTDITDIDDVTCLATTSGHGFFNEASLLNGTITEEVSDCATIPVGRITLLKTVDVSAFAGIDIDDLGFGDITMLTANDWNLSGSGDTRTVAAVGGAGTVFTVPTGDYLLDEAASLEVEDHPLLAYFFAQGWRCDGDETTTATVNLGELTSCSLVNKAELVDVGIEKEYQLDEGETAVEGGDTFDYVLTVTNHGSIDVPALDVTDLVDPELEVTGPATFADQQGDPATGWEQTSGDTDNAFAAHGDGPFAPGFVVTITIPVKLPVPDPVGVPDVATPGEPAPPTPVIDLDDIPNQACVAISQPDPEADRSSGTLADLIAGNNCDDVDVPKKAIDPAAYVRCVNDVPYLYYDIAVSENVEPDVITVTWTSGDGTLTEEFEIPWDDRSGRLLWPGAELDENGIPIMWPGWRPITEADLTADPPLERFLDLVFDPTLPDAPWHDEVNPSTITFSINPSQSVLAVYPQATPACAIEREPALDIVKTASVSQANPGADFSYSLQVTSTGIGAADPVELFDEIPANLRVDSITTDAAPAFPRWENCEVTGEDSAGYGGTLHCDLVGVLGPNVPAAPPVVLGVHLDSGTKVSSIDNTGEVCWQDADAPAEETPVVLCDDSTVTVRVPQPMAVTGFAGEPYIWVGALLLLLGGVFVGGTYVVRRRRAGAEV
ncbi:putative cupredoxin-like copper-binding protein [Agromyces hippuratus]|uniref:Putative cupredoxin-like copper-binding protein n=2 Tax=Agromyces hippuratus TaxID=286438 RepID=A0A852WS51_9MICO|nr:DUF5979 domain-containing protein [Agromyces hippuratus]NYG20567.1 putative cupredoxin-like copper-binding protein [Agromyces hippuratus]